MNPPKILAKSRGLAVEKRDDSTYVVRVDRRRHDTLLLWPLVLGLAISTIGFGAIAIAALIQSWGKDFGAGIGAFLTFHFMTVLLAGGTILAVRETLHLWCDEGIEINFANAQITLQLGAGRPKVCPLADVAGVNLSNWNAFTATLSLTMQSPQKPLLVQRIPLGYRHQLAEIEVCGRAIAEILQVPFTRKDGPWVW